MANGEYNDATLALISRLLVKNPEYYTLWNHRRRILSSSHFSIQMKPLLPPHTGADGSEASAVSTTPLDTGTPPNNEQQATVDLRLTPILSSELKSLLPLLRSFPKCYWIWEYRKWLLTQSQTLLSPAAANVFWQGDLSLVSKLLAADGRNFHAWEYRRFIVDSIEALRLAADPDKSRDAELRKLRCETEIAYTTQMIKKDLSNCSAWHYRSVLLPQMFLVFRTKGPSRNAYFEEGG